MLSHPGRFFISFILTWIVSHPLFSMDDCVTRVGELVEIPTLTAHETFGGEKLRLPAGIKTFKVAETDYFVSPQGTPSADIYLAGTKSVNKAKLLKIGTSQMESYGRQFSTIETYSERWGASVILSYTGDLSPTKKVPIVRGLFSVEIKYSEYDEYPATIAAMTLSPDNKLVAMGMRVGDSTGDTRLAVYDIATLYDSAELADYGDTSIPKRVAEPLAQIDIPFHSNVLRTADGFSQLSFSPDGRYLVGISFQTLRIYRLSDDRRTLTELPTNIDFIRLNDQFRFRHVSYEVVKFSRSGAEVVVWLSSVPHGYWNNPGGNDKELFQITVPVAAVQE